MNYSLNIGEWNSVFAVPASVVDKYIKIAGENSLKLLLYLLRHGGKTFTEDKLKADLGFRENGELEDAALFWIQRGIIRFESDGENRSLAAANDSAAPDIPQKSPENVGKTDDTSQNVQKVKPAVITSGEIAERIKSDNGIRMLFDEAEKLYGHPLKSRETNVVIALTDHYGLKVGAAIMLLKHCFKIGKTTPAYILSIAENWANDGITDINSANDKILSLERADSVGENLRKSIGLKTKLTAKMSEYIRVWTEDWGFSEEMIMLSYEKTVDRIKEFDFSYANRILENWNKNGIFTKDAAAASDAAWKKSAKPIKNNKVDNSSFDVDEIDELLNNYRPGGGS